MKKIRPLSAHRVDRDSAVRAEVLSKIGQTQSLVSPSHCKRKDLCDDNSKRTCCRQRVEIEFETS